MRAWIPLGLAVVLAFWGCAAPRSAEQESTEIEPESAAQRGPTERTRHSELVDMLESQPAKSLQVGEDHTLVVWSFEQRFSELESPVVHVVALEDRDGWIDWWYRIPAPFSSICSTPNCPLCTPTRVLWPLVDGAETPKQREQILRLAGLLTR